MRVCRYAIGDDRLRTEMEEEVHHHRQDVGLCCVECHRLEWRLDKTVWDTLQE